MASRLLWTEGFYLNLRRSFIGLSDHSTLGFKSTVNRKFHLAIPSSAVVTVRMPSLSPTMSEGTIVSWSKKEGDPIAPGDVLCEIQTDKAVVALECEDEGIFAKILVKENSTEVKVGTPIALWVDVGDDWKNVEIPEGLEIPSAPSSTTSHVASSPIPKLESVPSHDHTVSSSTRPFGPAVRSNLSRYGLSPTQILPSGPKGILLKNDVISYVNSNNIQPIKFDPLGTTESKSVQTSNVPKIETKPAAFKDIEITNMRRTIAKRLLESKTRITHSYATIQCSISSLFKLRKKLQNSGLKLSLNDFIIKSTANALAKCPAVNVVWEGEELKQKSQIDISIAVATENGLITPIVTNVGGKDVINISEDIRNLAEKARAGKLQPNEFIGGTFTISNLGMYGIHEFNAIINPPQCGILSVGGGFVTLGENAKKDTKMNVSLSYDARAVNEEDAARFLAHFKDEIETPSETSMNIFHLQSRIEQIEMFKNP